MQRRLSRLLGSVGLTVLLGAAAMGGASAQTYQVFDLGAVAVPAKALGIYQDALGNVKITGFITAGGLNQLVEWTPIYGLNGQVTAVTVRAFAGAGVLDPSQGNSIAITGGLGGANTYMAGTETVGGRNHAVAVNGTGAGSSSDLGTLGTGLNSFGLGTNAASQVVGYSQTNGTFTNHGFITASGGTTMVDLGVTGAGNVESQARDINASGTVAVTQNTAGNLHSVAIWTPTVPNGTAGSYTSTFSFQGANDSYASAINTSGGIAGYGDTTAGSTHAFYRTSGGIIKDLGTLEGDAFAMDVNDNAIVVGHSGFNFDHAFLVDASVATPSMIDLEVLEATGAGSGKDNHPGWVLNNATGITNSGLIVGYGTFGGQTHAFILTPNPVPAAPLVVLIGAGVFGIGMRRNRRR